MTEPRPAGGPAEEKVPLGQRLFDNVFLLLAAGILVMVLFYTAWGIWQMRSLTPAPLP
jgi:hypothetical protein